MPSAPARMAQASLTPADMRADEVMIIVRGFRVGWGREGVTRHLLDCAGYRNTEVQVLRESHGALPGPVAALHPGVACGDTLVAVVRPPETDRALLRLPRTLSSPGMDIHISIQVQGHGVDRSQTAAPRPTPPNPYRQAQRAREKAFRAARRHSAGATGANTHRPPGGHAPGADTPPGVPPPATAAVPPAHSHAEAHPTASPQVSGPGGTSPPPAIPTAPAAPGVAHSSPGGPPIAPLSPATLPQGWRAPFPPTDAAGASPPPPTLGNTPGPCKRGVGLAADTTLQDCPRQVPPPLTQRRLGLADNLFDQAGLMVWEESPPEVSLRPPRAGLETDPSPMEAEEPEGEPPCCSPPPVSPSAMHQTHGEVQPAQQVHGGFRGCASSAHPQLPSITSPPTPSLPLQSMEGVEFAVVLPDEGPEGELVELARYAVQEMVDAISTSQVNGAIAHILRNEPTTWREGVAASGSSSCPHNLCQALRRHVADMFPEIQPVHLEKEEGPDPEDAYPRPPSREDTSAPQRGGQPTHVRRSPREHRSPTDGGQKGPARKGRGTRS